MTTLLLILMREQGLTGRALARELNVSEMTVSHWLNRKFLPIPAHQKALEELFNYRIDDLLRCVAP